MTDSFTKDMAESVAKAERELIAAYILKLSIEWRKPTSMNYRVALQDLAHAIANRKYLERNESYENR